MAPVCIRLMLLIKYATYVDSDHYGAIILLFKVTEATCPILFIAFKGDNFITSTLVRAFLSIVPPFSLKNQLNCLISFHSCYTEGALHVAGCAEPDKKT